MGFHKGRSQFRAEFWLEFLVGILDGVLVGISDAKSTFDVFLAPPPSSAISFHIGRKIYNMITKNATNHANIFSFQLKIPRFGFERHVMMQLVHTSCQKPHLHHKLVPKRYLLLLNLPLTHVFICLHEWQTVCNGTFFLLLLVAARV